MKTWTNSVKLDYRPSQFHWEGIYKENMKKNTWKITINDMSRVSTEVLSASRIWRRDSVRICQNNIGYEYLLIPFLWEWTSIYQLFWCSPRVQGFDTLPFVSTRFNSVQLADSWGDPVFRMATWTRRQRFVQRLRLGHSATLQPVVSSGQQWPAASEYFRIAKWQVADRIW